MRGEFYPIWKGMWDPFWVSLYDKAKRKDLFCELSRASILFENPRADLAPFATVLSDTAKGREFFRRQYREVVNSEDDARSFLTHIYSSLSEDDDELAQAYFDELIDFIEVYSLRYEVRESCKLVPTLPGLYARMIRNLKDTVRENPNLAGHLNDFLEAVGDYVERPTEGRLKSTFVKIFNLLEAMALCRQETNSNTLGACAKEINSFPHKSISVALGNLYGFRSDQPGVGHAGKPAAFPRQLNDRDFIALNTILLGFVPYLIDELQCDVQ